MAITKTSILVPWRTDHGHRARVWNYLRPIWENTEYELCVGTDTGEGPFNCSMAVNDAARQATGDVYVIMGADLYPKQHAIDQAVKFTSYVHDWAPVFGGMDYLSRVDTDLVLARKTVALSCKPVTRDPTAMGIVAVRAAAWHEIDGMDERYSGWGWEDTALVRSLRERFGGVAAPLHVGLSFWHPTGHRDLSPSNPNRRLFESES